MSIVYLIWLSTPMQKQSIICLEGGLAPFVLHVLDKSALYSCRESIHRLVSVGKTDKCQWSLARDTHLSGYRRK